VCGGGTGSGETLHTRCVAQDEVLDTVRPMTTPLPHHRRGVTLPELIAALVILGVLASAGAMIGIPVVRQAQTDRVAANLFDLGVELQQHHQTRGTFPTYPHIADRIEAVSFEGDLPVTAGEVAIEMTTTSSGDTHLRFASVSPHGSCVTLTVPPAAVSLPLSATFEPGSVCRPSLAPEVP